MKKLLLSILIITSLTSYSQWQATSIFFQGENLTYAFGKAIACDDGFNTLQHSSDGGVTWLTSGVSGVPSTGLRFGTLNGSTLYAFYNDKIYQSTNGTTWSLMTAATATNDVVKSMCVHNGTVFATTSPQSGVSSKIFQLSGSSWTLKATHTGTILTIIRSISGNLWAGTTNTLALKSSNAGTSFAASNGTLSPSAFYDKYARALGATPTAMFMGNDGGRIFKSADGGNTWAQSYNSGASSSSSVSDIFITPTNAILVACDSGFVYSLDGVTWSKNNLGLGYSMGALQDQLLAVTMSANNVIVSTKSGKVFYRAASQLGLVGINESILTSIESKVYPNPANDFTTVEANDLMFEKNCEVKITDVLGRDISVTEMKNGKAELNLSNFSKGIYTYSVYNNKTVVSKGKLVVN
jgi:hypothetical protein